MLDLRTIGIGGRSCNFGKGTDGGKGQILNGLLRELFQRGMNILRKHCCKPTYEVLKVKHYRKVGAPAELFLSVSVF